MLELYKGTISIDDMKYKYSHKELMLLRDVRVERLRQEQAAMDGDKADKNASDSDVISRERARSMILEGLF